MKKVCGMLICVAFLVMNGFSQTGAPESSSASFFQVTGFAGAATVINACPIDFSYGLGARWTRYLKPTTGMILAADYNHRGGILDIDALDFEVMGFFGHDLYFAGGLYVSAILSFVAWDGWDVISNSDFGSVFDVGYNFPSIPGFTVGLKVNSGLIDLFPEDIQNTGLINQLNIHWGIWAGYKIF